MLDNIHFEYKDQAKQEFTSAKLLVKEPYKKPMATGTSVSVRRNLLDTLYRIIQTGSTYPTTVTSTLQRELDPLVSGSFRLTYSPLKMQIHHLGSEGECYPVLTLNNNISVRGRRDLVEIIRHGCKAHDIRLLTAGNASFLQESKSPKKAIAASANTPRLLELEADNKKWEDFFKIQNEKKEWIEWRKNKFGPEEGDDDWY